MHLCFEVYLIATLVYQVYGGRVHTALANIVFTNIDDDDQADVHSDYYFGKCTAKYRHKIVHRRVYTHKNLDDHTFIKGYLPGTTEPSCVHLRARSSYNNLVHYRAYHFNFCFQTETFIYCHRKNEKLAYLWFIPVKTGKDIEWDLVFYE